MDAYFGKVDIESIVNENCSSELNLSDAHVKFVHYPDCQQLIVWLPRPGRDYKKILLIDNKSQKTEKEWDVSDLLNGSIQLLWDTLSWKPGNYILEIISESGIKHSVSLSKQEKVSVAEKKNTEEQTEKPKAFTQYRDGFGNVIPDEDLILREKLAQDLRKKFGPWLEYTGNFRAGSIIYHDGNTRIEFYHEMGGGNCMFYVDIPTEKEWEGRTNTLLSERKGILDFVAKRVQTEQASNCNYTIGNDTITFNYK